jgi:hypothetical protein
MAEPVLKTGQTLKHLSKTLKAADYWRRYLAIDCQSEWAIRAPVTEILRDCSSI